MNESYEQTTTTTSLKDMSQGITNTSFVYNEFDNTISELIVNQSMVNDANDFLVSEQNSIFNNSVSNGKYSENNASIVSNGFSPKAVMVSNLYFSHRKSKFDILRDINMNVTESSIYCLLGPSGCGKTTLLRCITGNLQPYSGQIKVLGYTPGERGLQIPGCRVGYMPQELALYYDMTVNEFLCYFGKVHLCDTEYLKHRVEFLLSLLALPSHKNRLIGTLSGGQKRRVSFAAALIHSPPLLILDEPTAGVDPLLRDNIWKHLRSLCDKESITVIITTHYIEESRQADTVAMMRHGNIIAEEPPKQLLVRMQAKTLEDAFYNLCQNSSHNNLYTNISRDDKRNRNAFIVDNFSTRQLKAKFAPINYNFAQYLSVLWAVTEKNWTRNRRHYELMLFQFFMPVMIVVLFCYGIGAHPYDIPLAIVNEECAPQQSPLEYSCGPHNNLSLKFLQSIDSYFVHQYDYPTLDDGIAAVKSGRAWAVMHIKVNFSDSLHHRLIFESDVPFGAERENHTVDQSTVKVYADLTNKIISITMRRTLEEAFVRFCQKALSDEDYNPGLAAPPIMVAYPVYGSDSKHKGYTEYMVPGILINISFVMAGGLTALVFILERKEGMFERQWVSGIDTTQIIVAHFVIRVSTMVLQGIIVLTIILNWLELQTRGPIIWIFLMLLMQNCCGLTFGLVVSSLCRQESTAALIVSATVMTNLALCGMIWPIEAIPYYIRWFSYLQPSTLPTEALRSLMNRGWSIDHTYVWSGFMSTACYLIIFSVIASKFLKIKN